MEPQEKKINQIEKKLLKIAKKEIRQIDGEHVWTEDFMCTNTGYVHGRLCYNGIILFTREINAIPYVQSLIRGSPGYRLEIIMSPGDQARFLKET